MDKLLVVDGHNLLVRAIKAMEYRSDREMLQTASGVVTGPAVSFINMLTQHTRMLNPDYVVVCWDGGKSEYRTLLDPNYKGNRVAGSYGDEIGPNSPFTMCKEFLTLAGVPWILRRHVEADDLVAAYIADRPKGSKAYILSNDKDFYQLVSDDVTQMRVGLDEPMVTPKVVMEKLGVEPKHITALMALTGDKGDNIPGVPGIGPKTGAKILARNDFDLFRASKEEPKLAGYTMRIKINLSLVSLLMERHQLGTAGISGVPKFNPTRPDSVLWEELIGWLMRYELRAIRQRLEHGNLWFDSIPIS